MMCEEEKKVKPINSQIAEEIKKYKQEAKEAVADLRRVLEARMI